MSDSVQKVSLDYDNLMMIVDVIKANLIALPEHYVAGFEDYVLELADGKDTESVNEFWHNYIMCYAKYNMYELESIHNFWVEETLNIGWTYSSNFSVTSQTCPLLINFQSLTFEEQSLVRLFAGAIWALVVQDDNDEPLEDEISQDVPE